VHELKVALEKLASELIPMIFDGRKSQQKMYCREQGSNPSLENGVFVSYRYGLQARARVADGAGYTTKGLMVKVGNRHLGIAQDPSPAHGARVVTASGGGGGGAGIAATGSKDGEDGWDGDGGGATVAVVETVKARSDDGS
jgi:hypothetical protein